jgi:enoyl-CoA hydratase/carnithine racemase
MPTELLTEHLDHTLVLTLCDTQGHHALSRQVFTAGIESLNVAESNPEVRCVILCGEGGHFSNDSNLPLWEETVEDIEEHRRLFLEWVEALRVFPKPVIAAVEGRAGGDGFWLALACDLVVAASDASFLPFPSRVESAWGGSGPLDLFSRLTRQQWLQWRWLPQPLPAAELHRMGWVNWLAEPGQAMSSALQLAQRLSRQTPEALAQVKERAFTNSRSSLSLGKVHGL